MKLVILKRLGEKKTWGCWVLVWVVENEPKIKWNQEADQSSVGKCVHKVEQRTLCKSTITEFPG